MPRSVSCKCKIIKCIDTIKNCHSLFTGVTLPCLHKYVGSGNEVRAVETLVEVTILFRILVGQSETRAVEKRCHVSTMSLGYVMLLSYILVA